MTDPRYARTRKNLQEFNDNAKAVIVYFLRLLVQDVRNLKRGADGTAGTLSLSIGRAG